MMSSDELRQRAAHFRLIALDGEDLHFVTALHQLAEEFDAEAADGGQQVLSREAFRVIR